VLFVSIGLSLTALALIADGTNLFRSLELSTVDTRFDVRGRQAAPRDVVVVGIDDVTFGDLGVQWPFPRSLHGRLIDRLHRDGARVIAYDIQFTERTVLKEDNALIEAVARAGNIVLATTEVDAQGRANVFGGEDVVRQVGARVGNANIRADPGGVLRHVSYEVDGLQSFAVVTAERATGHAIAASALPGKSAWIDFRGPPGTMRYASFSQALTGTVPASFFRGKIVVVGPVAPSLQDVHPTSASGSGLMPGAEVEANAIWTVLHGFPLRSSGKWVAVLLIVVFGLFPTLAGLRLSLWPVLWLSVAVAATYVVAMQLAFDRGIVLEFVYPLTALALSTVGAVAAHYSVEAFERARVRSVFSRFVPEQVVDEVLARTDADLRLGGINVVGTIMFTDLRGFTTFSEEKRPDEVIDVVNHYLEQMSEAILAHGGTLIGYEGDGIMAVFGAPIEQEDHADRALDASREMLATHLPRFNEWLSDGGLGDGFRMGVGLHSGAFVAGNVGSARRLEYTAIGDVANTASRIQGMTKGTRHMLLFSEQTKAFLQRAPDDLVYVDSFDVRGRQAAIRLWSLEGVSDPGPAAAPEKIDTAPNVV
jgi:adenylate cyclase